MVRLHLRVKQSLHLKKDFLRAIFGEKAREVRDTSLKVPHGEQGIIVDAKVFKRENGDELAPGVNESVVFTLLRRERFPLVIRWPDAW